MTSRPQNMDVVIDVTGDGRAALVGFGDVDPTTGQSDKKTYVAVSRGNVTFDDFKPAIQEFGVGNGYNQGGIPKASLGDITGDRRSDVVGFSAAGVVTAVARDGGTFRPVAGRGRRLRVQPGLAGHAASAVRGRHHRGRAGRRRWVRQRGVYTAVAAGDGTFGGPATVAVVPDVRGEGLSAATTALRAAGLAVGRVTDVVDNTCNEIGWSSLSCGLAFSGPDLLVEALWCFRGSTTNRQVGGSRAG